MRSWQSPSPRPRREPPARDPSPATPTPSRFDPLWALGIALLLAVGLARAWLVAGLDHLPSPLFGGDYSFEMGCVRSILASRNPMASCSSCGGLPHYLPLYGTLLAVTTGASGVPVEKAMLGMSVGFRVLSVGLVGLVFARLYGRATGLVVDCLWALYRPQPILKYTEFTTGIVAPLYFFALYRYVQGPGLRRAIGVGLLLAVAGYSHTVVFVGGSLIAAVVVAVIAATGPAPLGRAPALARGAGHLAAIVACASLALGYWYRPIFVPHGRASAHYLEWNSGTVLTTLADRFGYAGRFLGSFLQVADWPRAIVNLLAVIGLVCLWLTRARARFLPGALIAGVTFAYLFHYFVTMPLFGTHFVPIYIAWMLWGFAVLFLSAIPATLAFDRLASGRGRLAVAAVVLAATIVGIVADARTQAQDPAVIAARQPLHPLYRSLQAYAAASTRPEDVALSTNELSFAWSALTGRKTVVTRRAHTDPYLDMDARNRDAALILYGSDDAARRRLLREYDVRYLFWTGQWIESEFERDPAGVKALDPLFYFANAATDS